MILSDRDILKELKSGEIVIKPFKKACVQPASYDVHLGNVFLIFNVNQNFVIDPKVPSKNLMKEIEIKGDEAFILHPGESTAS
jgi:dCTP deaminase